MKKHFLFSVFGFLCFCLSLMADPIRIETFRGKEIAPHLDEIVVICHTVYEQYPYLYAKNYDGCKKYFESFVNSPDSIVSIAYDGKNTVGLVTGIPMKDTFDTYQTVLTQKGYDLNSIYYLGEFGLKPEYKGQGVEEKLYKTFEDAVKKNNQYKTIAYWEIIDPSNTAWDYIPRDEFWKKMGFDRHQDLTFNALWVMKGNDEASSHPVVYFLKKV